MAEGFVLNISKEMLQRLDAADKKIVQIGESAEKAMKKINEAFGKKLTGVEDFIKQLNDIQQQLSKKDLKVNVDLALKNGALDSLKKQIEALGITIPVGVTATGTGGGNSAGVVPNGLNEALSQIATTIGAVNKTLASVVNIQEKLVNNNTQQGGKGRSNNTTQVQDPVNFSQNAKSITERIQAIKLLQKEMFNLDTTDKNYRTTLNNLNTELTRQQTVLKNLGIEIGKIKMPKIETPKPNFEPLRQQYRQNQSELKNLQSEYDKVEKKIRETEVQIANIKAGKGGSYNPTEYTENLKKRQNLSDEIKLYQDENKLITDKMRLLNQEYQAKVKAQQANDPKNIALIEKEKKEYEKLLKTISQLEKTKQKADRDIAKHGVNSAIGRRADVVSQQTDQQVQQAYQRKLGLERKYGTDLLQIRQANNVKELEEVRREGNDEIREYERVRSKILEINKTLYENSKTLKNTKDPNLQAQINNQNQALLNERSKLATRQLELERKHGNSLLSVQTQIGQKEVEFERKKQQDKIREVQQALRRRQDIERRWAQRNARLTEQKRNTADGALSFSQNEAKTIGQKLQAIKYLQNAQKSLDVTTSQGRNKFNELNREIKKTENELRRCGVQMNNLQEKSRHLFDITGQLGRALSLMFSVSQITQYVSKMVNVRKEMELQQRSLQVLLQNKDKANELWNQTLDLAVKSPFRVKELVTYTKQLAAYRIESDKLFETNKMLADVSAGLGVDMQRLILAFGQVKSASFLRGTELRQFTEAGIPMLEELSKYFSEIYGKSVSVAEVFDMISKRMVTFTDVEKVFQRMTGAGGVFFNMQEELSQTTAGMISNLQDSIDLMFNEMGKKNQGLINNVIKWARYIVDNWETVGKVMKGALLTLLMYKAATMDISKITKGWGDNVKFLFSELKENPVEFFQTFKGNIIMTALTAIIALVGKVIAEQRKYKRAIEEVNKAHEKFRKSVSDVELGFADLFSQGVGDLEEYKGKLQELVGIAQQSYNIEIDFKVNELDSIDEVSRKFDELKAKILSFDELSLQFDLDFVDANDRGLEWFEDYLGKDLTQLGESQKTISKAFYDIRTNMSGVLKDYYEYQRLMQNNNNLNEEEVERLEELSGRFRNANTEIFESFKKQNYDEETSYDFFQRNVEGLREWIKEYDRLLNKYLISYHQSDLDNLNNFSAGFTRADVTDFKILLKDYDDKIKEATIELDKFYQKTEDDISLKVADLNTTDVTVIEKELSNMVYNSLKKIATEKEYNELILNEMLSQAEKYYKNNLGYELDLMPKIKTSDPIKLKQWQQTFNEEVKKAVESISGKMKTKEYDYDLFGIFSISEDLQGLSTTETKKLAELNQALDEAVKRREEILGKQRNKSPLFKQEELDDINLYIKGLTSLRDLLGGDDDKSKEGKDTATQRIKDQISLIRQLYEEYQKLTKEMGATTAKGNVLSRFSDYANELDLDIKDIDFTNLQGIFDALQGLESSAKSAGADAMKALTKAMGETSVELELMFYIDERNKFENQIKDMFSDYELSLELDKLDIPADWAKTFFGVETKSLEEIQKVLKDRQTEIDEANKIDSKALEKYDKEYLTEEEKTIKKALELQIAGYKEESAIISNNEAKIQELIEKEQQERLKVYLYYARKSIGERAKLKLEEYNTLLDIEKTFKEQQDKIEKNENYSEAEKQRQKTINEQVKNDAIANVEKESKEKMDKLEWKEFQKTDTFINLFRDLENASETMLTSTLKKLQEFKKQWTDMPLEDMKQVIEKINELEMALANLSPRDTIKKSKENLNKYIEDNEIKGDYSDVIAKLQEENLGFETQNLELEKVISNLEVYFRLLEEGKKEQADEFYNKYLSEQKPIQGATEDGKQVTVDLSKQTELSRDQLKLLRKKVKLNQDNITNNQELLSDAEKLKNAYLKQAENIGKVQQVVGQLKNGFDSVVEAAAALGADTEDIELFGNMANDIISSTLGMVQLQLQLNAAQVAATGFGAAMNTAMGIIGWIVLAVQIIAKVISTIAKANDNRLLKQIEEQNRKIETLEKSYDKLSKAVDEAFTTEQLKEYNKELVQTTQSLITAQKAAIAAQEQRKGSNNEGSDEWKELQEMYEKLEEYETQLEESQKNIYSKLTGGIMDDILSTTESFVDAWYDAFKETGDGLKGLEDSFNEMLLNLVKRQAAMKIAGRFIDEWDKALERYASDGDLSNSEIEYYANKVKNDLPALSSQLEAFFSSFDNVLGDASGNLSGLQRGVTQIQESTAQELASYLNSIRYIVSDSNVQLKTLVAHSVENNNSTENPMISQLKIIAQQTSAINTLLNSLTAPHPTLSGRGLKVVI